MLVRSAADYRAFFRYILGCLVVLLPFALVEFVARQAAAGDIFEQGVHGRRTIRARAAARPGARRRCGFAHSIHFGVICSLAVANVYYIYRDRFLKSLRVTGFVLFMLFLSLSSAPMLSAAVQIAMIGWDRILRFIRGHWVIGVLAGLVTLAVLQMLLPGGMIGYLVNEVIFNPYGGNNRIAIFQYGTAEVLRHPLLRHRARGLAAAVLAARHGRQLLAADGHALTACRRSIFLVLAIGISAARIMSPAGSRPRRRRATAPAT